MSLFPVTQWATVTTTEIQMARVVRGLEDGANRSKDRLAYPGRMQFYAMHVQTWDEKKVRADNGACLKRSLGTETESLSV